MQFLPDPAVNWTASTLRVPGKDGLLHISQIANERVNVVAGYLKEGQQMRVKVLEADERCGLKLPMKAVAEEAAAAAAQ